MSQALTRILYIIKIECRKEIQYKIPRQVNHSYRHFPVGGALGGISINYPFVLFRQHVLQIFSEIDRN